MWTKVKRTEEQVRHVELNMSATASRPGLMALSSEQSFMSKASDEQISLATSFPGSSLPPSRMLKGSREDPGNEVDKYGWWRHTQLRTKDDSKQCWEASHPKHIKDIEGIQRRSALLVKFCFGNSPNKNKKTNQSSVIVVHENSVETCWACHSFQMQTYILGHISGAPANGLFWYTRTFVRRC